MWFFTLNYTILWKNKGQLRPLKDVVIYGTSTNQQEMYKATKGRKGRKNRLIFSQFNIVWIHFMR